MKKFLKLMLGIGGCIFYYIVFCAILGADFGDPWDKIMSWVKGDKKDNKKEPNYKKDNKQKDSKKKMNRKYISLTNREE